MSPGPTTGPLHLRPAVVGTGHDAVDLVDVLGAEFAGPQPSFVVEGKALDVAVPHGEHRRAGIRVVCGDRAVSVDAQDLAGQARRVLGVAWGPGIAGGDEQRCVRREGEPSAVMDAALGDAAEDHGGRTESSAVPGHPYHSVVATRGEHGVDRVPARRHSESEQTSLALMGHAGHGTCAADAPPAVRLGEQEDLAAVPQAHQGCRVAERGDAPRRRQADRDIAANYCLHRSGCLQRRGAWESAVTTDWSVWVLQWRRGWPAPAPGTTVSSRPRARAPPRLHRHATFAQSPSQSR